MSSDNFKGWEHVDGSKVSREETESAFNAVMQKARQIEGAYISKKIKDKTLWFKKISVAAAAVAILVLSPLAAYYIIKSPADMNEYTASRGEIVQVTLPDGSTVVLNSESTLIYPEKFGRKRAVTLSGEALFTVTASKRHPFIVSTDDICVTAHGTVFNVSDYPEDLTASATLCSGVVSVCKAGDDDREVTLTPDQALTLEKASGSMTVKKTDAKEQFQNMSNQMNVMIYFLIAGTYTPVCMIPLDGTISGRVMLLIIWSMAILGSGFTLFWINMPRIFPQSRNFPPRFTKFPGIPKATGSPG